MKERLTITIEPETLIRFKDMCKLESFNLSGKVSSLMDDELKRYYEKQ